MVFCVVSRYLVVGWYGGSLVDRLVSKYVGSKLDSNGSSSRSISWK